VLAKTGGTGKAEKARELSEAGNPTTSYHMEAPAVTRVSCPNDCMDFRQIALAFQELPKGIAKMLHRNPVRPIRRQ
jgi:hypothetical protein